MSEYRVTAEFLIRSTPKHARKKAEALVRGLGLPEATVKKVFKLNRKKRREKTTARKRRLLKQLRVWGLGLAADVQPGIVWRTVRKATRVKMKMPKITVGNPKAAKAMRRSKRDKRGMLRYEYEVLVPESVEVSDLVHEFLHCALESFWFRREFHSKRFEECERKILDELTGKTKRKGAKLNYERTIKA